VTAELTAPSRQAWDVTVSIDGEVRGKDVGLPLLFGMSPFEGIDVGIDRRSPVSWELYEQFGPFAYTGTLHSVSYSPGDPAPDAPMYLLDVLRDLASKYE
jgi:arylsulfatase